LSVDAELTVVERRQLTFTVQGGDETAVMCRGGHRRAVIDRERFEHKLGALLAAQAGTVRAAEHTTNESSTDDRM
jgi:predicted thioesterase